MLYIYLYIHIYISVHINNLHGQCSKFLEELDVGDNIVVTHHNALVEETKIISMILSNSSVCVYSSFSADLISGTSFRYIKAPKDTYAETLQRRENDILGMLALC